MASLINVYPTCEYNNENNKTDNNLSTTKKVLLQKSTSKSLTRNVTATITKLTNHSFVFEDSITCWQIIEVVFVSFV